MYIFYIICLICSRFIRTAFSFFLETMTILSLSISVCIEVINQKLRQHQYHCYAVLPYNLLAVFRDKYLNSCYVFYIDCTVTVHIGCIYLRLCKRYRICKILLTCCYIVYINNAVTVDVAC